MVAILPRPQCVLMDKACSIAWPVALDSQPPVCHDPLIQLKWPRSTMDGIEINLLLPKKRRFFFHRGMKAIRDNHVYVSWIYWRLGGHLFHSVVQNAFFVVHHWELTWASKLHITGLASRRVSNEESVSMPFYRTKPVYIIAHDVCLCVCMALYCIILVMLTVYNSYIQVVRIALLVLKQSRDFLFDDCVNIGCFGKHTHQYLDPTRHKKITSLDNPWALPVAIACIN